MGPFCAAFLFVSSSLFFLSIFLSIFFSVVFMFVQSSFFFIRSYANCMEISRAFNVAVIVEIYPHGCDATCTLVHGMCLSGRYMAIVACTYVDEPEKNASSFR